MQNKTLILFSNFCTTCGRGLSVTARLRSKAKLKGYNLTVKDTQYNRHNQQEALKLNGKPPFLYNPETGKTSQGTEPSVIDQVL